MPHPPPTQQHRPTSKQRRVGRRQKVGFPPHRDKEHEEDEIRPPEDPIARTAFGEEVPQSCPPQEQREGIHDEDLVEQEIEGRPSGTMILGIARPILHRRPAVGGIPEQEGQEEREGDQSPKQRPAGEQQAALWGQQQADDQGEPPEEDGLLRQ